MRMSISDRTLARLSRGLFVFIAVMFVGALALGFVERPKPAASSWGSGGFVANLFFLLTMGTFGTGSRFCTSLTSRIVRPVKLPSSWNALSAM